MRRSIFNAVVAASLVGWLPLAGAESAPTATGGDLSIDQVPAPARAAIQRQAGGQDIRWVQRGVVDGKPVYTARIRQPGLDQRVVVGEDGALVSGGDVGGSSAGGEDAVPAHDARVGDAATTSDHVGLADMPAAVKSTIERIADGREIASITRERRDGLPVFRAKLAGAHEIVVDANGGVLGGDRDLIDAAQAKPAQAAQDDAADRDLQKDIALDQAPDAVQATLKREAGAQAIKWVQRDIDDGQLVYRARIEQSGLDKRLTVAPDGKLLETKDYSDAKTKTNGAWEKTKEVSKDAWDKTKEGTSRAWDKAAATVGDHPKLEDLPPAVRTTIEAKAGNREIRDVKHELKDGKHLYDAKIHVKDGADEHVVVDETGGVVENAR